MTDSWLTVSGWLGHTALVGAAVLLLGWVGVRLVKGPALRQRLAVWAVRARGPRPGAVPAAGVADRAGAGVRQRRAAGGERGAGADERRSAPADTGGPERTRVRRPGAGVGRGV